MATFWISGGGCDPSYQALRDNPRAKGVRDIVVNMWNACSDYLDSDFRNEFSKQPEPRFWELLLCSRLLHEDKKLIRRVDRPAKKGPDFIVDEGEHLTWIEAVNVGLGDPANQDRVPELPNGEAQRVPMEKVELRIATIIDKKIRKLTKFDGFGPNDAVIIAANPTSQLGPRCSTDARMSPFHVAYPIGNQYVGISLSGGPNTSGFENRFDIKKISGVEVPVGFFARADNRLISGIIWSTTTLGSIRLNQPEFAYFPNPFANNALSERWASWEAECRCRLINDDEVEISKVA